MGEQRFVRADPASAEARDAMTRYFAEIAARFPAGLDPGDAVERAATSFVWPHGVFVLVTDDDGTAGCGAVQFLDETTAEVKRMWVHPRTRGTGLGRRLLEHLEHVARDAGRRTVVLDTNGALTEAMAMYRRCGYDEVEPYNDNADADHWFRKEL